MSAEFPEAATEFQNSSTIAALWGTDPIGALAHFKLGRAFALSGDQFKAKAAYADFLRHSNFEASTGGVRQAALIQLT